MRFNKLAGIRRRRGHNLLRPCRASHAEPGRNKLWPLLIGLLLVGCSTQTPAIPTLTGMLPMHVVSSLQAGTTVRVLIGPIEAHNGTSVTLVTSDSYGPHIYQTAFRNRIALFVLAGKDTQQSGVMRLIAHSGAAQGTASLTIEPGPPVEPLTPLVGARAITADAAHWSMLVLIPFDRFGNPVAEGTRIQVRVLHPGNRLEQRRLSVRDLLAWTRVYSGTKAGRTTIAANIGQVHGFEGTLLEVPGWPVPFHIVAEPQSLSADGHLLTTLQTDVLRDSFGNVMPDGTGVTFIVQAHDGTQSYLPTHTINGVATIPLQAGDVPGVVIAYAVVLNIKSTPLTVTFTFGPTVGTFPITLHRGGANGSYTLDAGPLLGSLGQYIPDGTDVSFHLTNATGGSYMLDTVADSGHATVELRTAVFPAGVYKAEVTVGSGHGSLTFRLS